MYDQAWNTLQQKFGQLHHNVSSQLVNIQNFPLAGFNDLSSLIELFDTISTFLIVLQHFGYSNDLFSYSNLDIVITNLPLDRKRRSFAFIESPSRPSRIENLLEFKNWLQEETQVHEEEACFILRQQRRNLSQTSRSWERSQISSSLRGMSLRSDKKQWPGKIRIKMSSWRFWLQNHELREIQRHEDLWKVQCRQSEELVFLLWLGEIIVQESANVALMVLKTQNKFLHNAKHQRSISQLPRQREPILRVMVSKFDNWCRYSESEY